METITIITIITPKNYICGSTAAPSARFLLSINQISSEISSEISSADATLLLLFFCIFFLWVKK